MTQGDIESFLKAGALLRQASGKVLLWRGPFEALPGADSPKFSIGYASFFDGKATYMRASDPPLELEVGELRRDLKAFVGAAPETLERKLFENPTLEVFQKSFQAILGKIHRGEIEKAVPVVFAKASRIPTPVERAQMLDHALEAHAELFVYGFWNEAEGILGATPEVLFHQKPERLQSMALAGTYSKKIPDAKASLLKDPKERHEHQLVIDDIRERLSKFGRARVSETHVVEYPALLHLRTWIEVDQPSGEKNDYLKSLHPTPALGVSPRNYGIEWMKDLPEQKERGLFGAPILFSISESETLALVAIRNLIWEKGESKIGTGCGLVEASDMQKEWLELETKRESVFQILGLKP